MATEIGFLLKVQGGKAALDDVTKFTLRLQEIPAALKAAKEAGNKELYAKLKGEQIELRSQLANTTRELRKQVTNFEKAKFPTDSIIAMEARYSELRDTIRRTSQTDPGFKKMVSDARALKDEIREVSEGFGDTTPNIGNYREAIEKALQGQGSLIGNLKQATGSLLNSPLAVGGAVLTGLGLAAGYARDVTEEFIKLRGEAQKLTGLEGFGLDRFVTDVTAISRTFDKEFNEVQIAANALTKNLTGDFDESIRLIEQGFINGADSTGEFLDILREYPTFFKEAGLSGQQFLNIIQQQVNTGIYSDKGIDAVKEASIRLRELPTAAQEAITAIGLEVGDVKDLIAEKGLGAAIALISEKLGELKADSPEVGQAIADIFGGPGEDAGLDFLLSLKNIDGEITNVKEGTEALVVIQKEQLENEKALAEAQNELSRSLSTLSEETNGFFTKLKTFGTTALTALVDWFNGAEFVDAAIKKNIASTEEYERSTERLNKLLGQTANKPLIFRTNIEEVESDVKTGSESVVDAFDKLSTRQKELKEEIQNAIISGKPYASLMAEYERNAVKLSAATDVFTKKTKDQTKEVEAAAGSMTALKKELTEIQKTIDTSGENVLEEELQKLISKQAEIDALEAKIAKIKFTLSDKDTTSFEPIKLPTLSAFGEDSIIQGNPELDNFIRIQDQLKQAKEEEDLLERERLLNNAQASIENDDLTLEQRKELYKKFYEETGELAKDFEDKSKRTAEEVTQSMNRIIATTINASRQGQDVLQSFLRATGIELLNAIERQIDLLLVKILAQEIASKSAAGIATAAAFGLLIKGGLAIARSRLQSFAEGGVVQPEKTKPGIITARQNITPLANGDNVLATVRTGETILTPRHVQRLGGVDAFRRAGVPGYADGGVVGGARGIPNVISPASAGLSNTTLTLSDEQIERFAQISAIRTANETARKVAESVGNAILEAEAERQAYNDLRNTYG